MLQALQFVKNAISFDPDYGPALAVAGLCHMRLWMEGWAEEPDIARQKGIQYAQHALHVAAGDPTVLANAAYVLARLGEDIDAMMALLDRSLALNPSFARGWYLSGALRMSAGQLDTAIEHINKSLRLSPRDHFFGVPLYMLGATYFAMRRFDEAVAKLLQAIQEHPEYPGSYRFLAACYAHMGRVEAAHEMIERLERLTPVVAASPTLFRVPEHRELLESGLRLAAGGEEI